MPAVSVTIRAAGQAVANQVVKFKSPEAGLVSAGVTDEAGVYAYPYYDWPEVVVEAPIPGNLLKDLIPAQAGGESVVLDVGPPL